MEETLQPYEILATDAIGNPIVPLTPVENTMKNTVQKIGTEEYAWENMYLQKMLREETQKQLIIPQPNFF